VDASWAGADERYLAAAGHPDRELGLMVIERLTGADPASERVCAAVVPVLAADLTHGARLEEVLASIRPLADDAALAPLARALDDERHLVRARIRACLTLRHGRTTFDPILLGLDAEGSVHALAVEALEVEATDHERAAVLALVADDESSTVPPADGQLDPDRRIDKLIDELIDELIDDAESVWRSQWLRTCAVHARQQRSSNSR
jgi:hypothetical protein